LRTSSISWRVARSFIEMIIAVLFAGVFSFAAKFYRPTFLRRKKFRETGAKLFCGK